MLHTLGGCPGFEGHYFDRDYNAMELAGPPGSSDFLAVLGEVGLLEAREAVIVELVRAGAVCLLLFLMGREACCNKANLTVAMTHSPTPRAILWSLAIKSATLFVLLVAAAVRGLSRARSPQDRAFSAFSGAALGLSVLPPPIGLMLIPARGKTEPSRSEGS